jgi:O-antigen ligase
MSHSHMAALVLLPILTIGAAAAAAWFERVRDIFFVAMVSLSVVAEHAQVNFFSEGWYRGSARGIQFTLIEIMAFGLLFGCIVVRRTPGRRLYWPASLGLILLYVLYCCGSVVLSQPKVYGAFELSRIFASILIFLAAALHIRSRREWTQLVVALGIAVGFEGIWSAKQHFFMGLDRAAGTLDHANSLSMYFCLTVPVLFAVAVSGWSAAIRLFCGVCSFLGAVGILFTFSRAGLPVFCLCLAGVFVSCASWKVPPSRLIVRGIFLAGVAVLAAAGWGVMERRYAQATFEQEYLDTSVDGRGVYLRLSKMLVTEHFFGVGLNNWSFWVSRSYGARLGYRFDDYDEVRAVYGEHDDKVFANSYLAAPAHNLAALTLGELGVPGFLIFGALWLRWLTLGIPCLRLPRDTPIRTLGLGIMFSVCGIFGQSLTEWVSRQTPILFTLYILLGAAASVAHSRREAAGNGGAPQLAGGE